MSKKLLLTICLLATTIFMASAQSSWQWGKRGGSSDAGFGGPDESVVDMATDQHGNIYVLSTVLQTGFNIDGHAVAEWGGYDVSISSFKCDGSYRWSKTIGGSGDDHGMALRTDTLGGVYVTGYLATHFITIHIDADSAWFTGTSYKSFYVAKFDTAGTYKWFRMPQADTVGITAYSFTGPLDMDVDGAGNIDILSLLPPGVFGGSYVVSGGVGVHMLRYDRYGNFTGGMPMQITVSGIDPPLKMKRDHRSGRYYVTGAKAYTGGTLSFGSTPITHPLFIGAFDNSGTLLWNRQSTTSYGGNFGRAAIDDTGNIYLACGTGNGDTFNGFTVVNTITSIPYGGPFIVKIDSAGTNKWGMYGSTNAATGGTTVTLNGNIVSIAGEYPGRLIWPGYSDTLSLPGGSLTHIFITRFDAGSGSVINVDTLESATGYHTNAMALASDNLGNFYVGGDFESTITVNGTTLNSAGGGSDFFIAKYGTSNCSGGTLEAPPGLTKGEDVLRVYPNPARDELVIENAVGGSAVKLLNMMGQVMYESSISGDYQVISTKNLVNGMYVFQVTDVACNRTIKTIVKQ